MEHHHGMGAHNPGADARFPEKIAAIMQDRLPEEIEVGG